MVFYKTAKWKNKRGKILRRDEYLCRECRRYGRTAQATTVHHIYPVEQYPEWKLASWNMISLCHECHNKMHDRDNGALTALGQSWVDRVSKSCNTIKSNDVVYEDYKGQLTLAI